MKANWVVVLMPPFLVCMTLLFGTQFVFLQLGFFRDLGIGQVGDEFELFNYMRAFTEPFFLNALKLNFILAVAVVAITLIVAYPIAYIVARMNPKWAIVFLTAMVVSSFVSIVIKVLGIIIIFGADGPVNRFLLWTGIVDEYILVVGTKAGVIMGLTHLGIAFMVMMLFSVIQSIPRSLEEAAEIHGANRWRVFWRVVIPLSMPGVVSASLLLFNIAMGAFVSAVLLGGGKVMTLPIVIQRTILLYTEYGMAAALSGMLMLFVFAVNIASVVAVTRMRAARFAVT